MRMRKKKNLIPRMERHADRRIMDPYAMPGRWRELMPEAREIRVEVGCGKGLFTAESAAAEPDVLFVAVEMVPEAVVVAMERCAERENVRFVIADAKELPSFFAPGEVDRIYLNFSDPWPSRRHARRRLTHGRALRGYREILHPGGQIWMKTDNVPLFDFSLSELPRYGFSLSEVTRDLHADGVVGPMTDYEKKFHAQGVPICRLVGTMEADWEEPFPDEIREVRRRWLEAFAADVSREDLEARALSDGDFLWHLFSWGLVPCLEGDAARRALSEKEDCYLFYHEYPPAGVPRIRHIGRPDPASLPPDDGRLDGADWYLVDQAFTWTYVHTHEEGAGLGPYFRAVPQEERP